MSSNWPFSKVFFFFLSPFFSLGCQMCLLQFSVWKLLLPCPVVTGTLVPDRRCAVSIAWLPSRSFSQASALLTHSEIALMTWREPGMWCHGWSWPHKPFHGSLSFPGEGSCISISWVCSVSRAVLMIHISLSGTASFHSVSLRQQVLATAWSSIWLMENSLSVTYWCLTPVFFRMTAGAQRCAQPAESLAVWFLLFDLRKASCLWRVTVKCPTV